MRPDEDIEAAVSSLYRRIGAPVMTDVDARRSTSKAPSAADGADGQPHLSRRARSTCSPATSSCSSAATAQRRRQGDAQRQGRRRKEQSFDFPAELVEKSGDDTNAFVEKLWAMRRVGEIIDELDLKGRNEELVKELVDLATKHGILTPYTSFLADDTADVRDTAGARRAAPASGWSSSARADGEAASASASAKERYRMAGAAPAPRGRRRDRAAASAAASAAWPAAEASATRLDARRTQRALAARGGRGVTYYDAESDEQGVADNVIAVGRKTFFRRGDRWVDSTITDDEEKGRQDDRALQRRVLRPGRPLRPSTSPRT